MAEVKIVVITGANTGIGFETVKALLRSKKQYSIFLGSRSLERATQAAQDAKKEIESADTIEPIQIDIESDESIAKAFEFVSSKVDRIDALINNAGAAFDGFLASGELTARQMWNKTWDVNVTGSHMVTEAFLPLLIKGNDARLIFNTSGLSSLGNAADVANPRYAVPPAGLPKPQQALAYRSAKTGLNMVMTNWARLLKNDGVKVFAVSPGFLATGLGGNPELLKKAGAGDPSLGGQALCGVLEGKRDDHVGRVVCFYGDEETQPW